MNTYNSDGWFDESDRDKINLLECVFRGDLDEVKKYLSGGKIDVNEADTDGTTALQIACAKGHRNLVEFLIERGANIESANFAGMTPFLHACREGHIDVVVFILLSIVFDKILIKSTLLLVTFLCNRNANIDQTTGLGVTAMTLACAGGHAEVVARTLKMLGVDINTRKSAEYSVAPSPLMVACYNTDIEICSFLSQNYADRKFRLEHLKLNVEEMIKKCGIDYMLKILRSPDECVEVETKIEPKKGDIKLVIQTGDQHELLMVLHEKAPAAVVQMDGVTPLMYAAAMKKLKMAEIILNHPSCSIDAQENVLGMTALMFAVVASDDAMVMLLLNRGSNFSISSTTKTPFTAVDLSLFSKFEHRETLRQLYLRSLCSDGVPTNEESRNSSSTNSKTEAKASTKKKFISKVLEGVGTNIGIMEPAAKNIRNPWTQAFELPVSVVSNVNLDTSPCFVLAEQILCGETKVSKKQRAAADDYVETARSVALNWIQFGDSKLWAHESRFKNSYDMFAKEDTHKTHKPYKSDGHYSIVQKNTEEMLKRLNNVKKAAHHDVQRFHRSNDRKSIGSSSQVQQRNKSFFDSSPKQIMKTAKSVQRIAPHRQNHSMETHFSTSESSMNANVHRRTSSAVSLGNTRAAAVSDQMGMEQNAQQERQQSTSNGN